MYIYIYIYVCIYIYIYMYICTYMSQNLCMSQHVYLVLNMSQLCMQAV